MASLDDVLTALKDNTQLLQRLIDLLTPKLVFDAFNESITGGNSFGTATPRYPVSAFRIYITVNTAGTFSIVRNKLTQANTKVTETNNAGALLNANDNYIFDILTTDDEQISFQFSANAILLSLKVYEVPAMIV